MIIFVLGGFSDLERNIKRSEKPIKICSDPQHERINHNCKCKRISKTDIYFVLSVVVDVFDFKY